MNESDLKDNEPTVQLPKLPVPPEEFDPDKTVVVNDWSQVPMTRAPESAKPR